MADGNDPLGTVQRMFSAFGAGRIDGVMETLHPDSHWTYFGANPTPRKAEFVGKARVRGFFEGIIKRVEMTAFNATEYIVHEDTVVVFGNESGKVRANGESFHNEWTQKYIVKDNLITNMVEYNIQVEP